MRAEDEFKMEVSLKAKSGFLNVFSLGTMEKGQLILRIDTRRQK